MADLLDELRRLRRPGVRVENSARMLKLFQYSFRNRKSPLTCYAGYNSLAVDCYGEIYPCLPWANWGRSVASAGSGVHQVLLLLAFFYARPSSVFLLDEPYAHLHVFLQKHYSVRRVKLLTPVAHVHTV